MPAPTWPATLPQKMRLRLPIQRLDNRARFQPDSGPPRSAVRTTATVAIWTPEPFIIGETQLGILRTFRDTTCYHGQTPFEWTNPRGADGLKTFQWDSDIDEVWLTQAVPLPAAMGGNQAYRAGGAATQKLIQVSFRLLELPWNP